jgi:hypothetical protein
LKKIQVSGPGILIGIPTLGRPVHLDWALAFKAMSPPINFNTNFAIVRDQEIGLARTQIAKQAIEQGAKYLFFLGDDVIVPPHGIRQLIYRMEQNPTIGVAGGVYCTKCDPSFPLVFKEYGKGSYWDWKVGEFFEVVGLGMDATLIRVDVLKKLSDPFFKTVDVDKYLDGTNAAEQWTEDLFFCRKVLEETDYKIYCEGSVCCKHVDIYSNTAFELPADSLPMRQLLIASGRKKKLVIGAKEKLVGDTEFIHIYFGEEEWHDYRGTTDFLPFESGYFDSVAVVDDKTHPLEEIQRVQKVA